MNSFRKFGFHMLLALVGGFLGGMLSSGSTVFAEKKDEVLEVIKAKRFSLVDDKGKERMIFRTDDLGNTIEFVDEEGRVIAFLADNELTFYDKKNPKLVFPPLLASFGYSRTSTFLLMKGGNPKWNFIELYADADGPQILLNKKMVDCSLC